MFAPCQGAFLFNRLNLYYTTDTFSHNIFLVVDEFHLRSALFDSPHTPMNKCVWIGLMNALSLDDI